MSDESYKLEIADGSARWYVVLYRGDTVVERWLYDSYEAALTARDEWVSESS